MNFEDKIYDFISGRKLIASDDKVLLGVSGGADSVCLFRVLVSLCEKFNLCKSLTVVHLNHMIRGEEADKDQRFVEALCEKYGVSCHSYRRDIPALSKDFGLSEEETGRKVRYELFAEAAAAYGCTKIAVAHHKNDLAETVIFNMVRGSGLSGLSGISALRENIVRPLLASDRREIEDYLAEIGQDFRTDSTNEALDYTRNKIRHSIIPVLEELNREAVEHIAALAADANRADIYLEEKAAEAFGRADIKPDGGKAAGNSVSLAVSRLRETDETVLEKLIHNCLIKVAGRKKDITRRHISSVIALVYSDTGKQVVLPYNMLARISYDILIIEEIKKTDQESSVDEIIIDTGRLPEGALIVELGGGNEDKHPRLEFLLIESTHNPENFMEKNVYTKIFSYDKILAKNAARFCIRTKREGDYIVIDPDGRRKKLNRVFIDAKLDREKRKDWPLVALDDEILWAVGLRYNEAYRVTEDTERILKVTYIDEN